MQTKIILKPYENSWKSDFEYWVYECSQLLDLSDTAEFQHMGSTAIPEVVAKPTIDILLGVDRIEQFSQKNIKALEDYGFNYVAVLEEEFPYRRYFQLFDEQGEHLVHLHVVTKGGNFWHQHLLFRNYLLKHPDAVNAYSQIKQQAAKHAQSRDEYTAAKTAFVFNCLREAFVDRELNPPLQIQENRFALQPQVYMTGLVAKFYTTPEQCTEDIVKWDREGKGPLWWFTSED